MDYSYSLGRMTNPVAKTRFLEFTKTLEEIPDDDDPNEFYDDGIDEIALGDIVSPGEFNTFIKNKKSIIYASSIKAIEESVGIVSKPDVDKSDINYRGLFGFTKLHQGVVDKDVKKIKELLKAGANKNIKDNSGHTPFDKAILGDLRDPVVKEMCELLDD